MSRLVDNIYTFKGKVEDVENDYIIKVQDKLADYEDKEEQGLLIELPCKVGDTFWELSWSEVDRTAYPRVAHSLQHCCYVKDKLGTWCFLTKAEAEEALARMKEEALAKMGGK